MQINSKSFAQYLMTGEFTEEELEQTLEAYHAHWIEQISVSYYNKGADRKAADIKKANRALSSARGKYASHILDQIHMEIDDTQWKSTY